MSRYIGIAQNWKMDEERLGAGIDLSCSSPDPFQILLFPEGGCLNAEHRDVILITYNYLYSVPQYHYYG